MRKEYPQFKSRREGKNILFTGELKVKPEFPSYTVSILYRHDKSPHVKILSPTLVDKPPHFYQSTGTLCLYLPKNYRWSKHRLISKEIVSWTAGWIYFYEIWLQTGKWFGPEAKHNTDKKNE